MIAVAASFWALMLMTCVFAAGFGGRDGRIFAVMFFGSVLLTMPALLVSSGHGTQYWVMAVDVLLFVGLFRLMLRSAAYWPIWTTASQFLTVLTHVVTLLLQSFSDRIYEGLSTVWVIPLMLFTIIGIEQDRKQHHDRSYPPGPRAA
jgi:hypothetical protein